MPARACDHCGRTYEAKRPTSRFCEAKCRVAHHQQGGRPRVASVASVAVVSSGLVESVTAELEAAGRLDSSLGQQALELARRMVSEYSGSGASQVSRELRAVMSEALGASTVADPLDEVRNRRERKARQAAG